MIKASKFQNVSKNSGVLMASVTAFALVAVACGAGTGSVNGTDSAVLDEKNAPAAEVEGVEKDSFVVPFVDISRYVGLWYEIASIPQPFQGFCQNTRAEYAILGPGEISVFNQCNVGFVNIPIEGKARVVDATSNAILEVSFQNIERKADYRIIALDKDYEHALVTNKQRSSLFVLSRTKTMSPQVYEQLLSRAKDAGVDVSKVEKTPQK